LGSSCLDKNCNAFHYGVVELIGCNCRKYGQAVQELSICMAFAPEEEAKVLEAFVEKLHLLRLESSWKSLGHTGQLTVP